MSGIMGAKAISLVTDGQIVERPHARVFHAQGSEPDPYRVVIDPDGDTCTCRAGREGRECYHLLAAHLVIAQQRRQRHSTATATRPIQRP